MRILTASDRSLIVEAADHDEAMRLVAIALQIELRPGSDSF